MTAIEMAAYPTWKRTLGPIQKKQSTIRNAKIIGMLLMNLGNQHQHKQCYNVSGSYKLRNQGSEATESCTSTSWK